MGWAPIPRAGHSHTNISVCSRAALLYGRPQLRVSCWKPYLQTRLSCEYSCWYSSSTATFEKLYLQPFLQADYSPVALSKQYPCARSEMQLGQKLRFVAIMNTLSPKAFLSHTQNPPSWGYQVHGRFLWKDGHHQNPYCSVTCHTVGPSRGVEYITPGLN